MPSEPIQAVAFDHDGLMFNTEDLYVEVGAEVLRRRGHQLTRELLDEMLGRPSPIALQIMIDRYGLDDTVAGLATESTEIFASILPTRLEPMPGLMPLLDRLAANSIPTCVVTSSVRELVTTTLELTQVTDRFAFTITAEDVRIGKPDPEPYLMAAERFGVDPARMMVLEDSPVGCQAAVASGAFVVAVPGPHSSGFDFGIAHVVAESLADPRIHAALPA